MTDDNPMPKIAELRDLVARVGKPLGLTLEGFAVFPEEEDGVGDVAQVIFRIDTKVAFGTEESVDPEQAQFDAALEQIRLGERNAEIEALAAQAKAELVETLGTLRPKDGIGLDD